MFCLPWSSIFCTGRRLVLPNSPIAALPLQPTATFWGMPVVPVTLLPTTDSYSWAEKSPKCGHVIWCHVTANMSLVDGACWGLGCLCVIGSLHAGLGPYVWAHTRERVPLGAPQAGCTSANGCMWLQTVDMLPGWRASPYTCCYRLGVRAGSELCSPEYLNVLWWIAFPRFWSIYYVSCGLLFPSCFPAFL